VIFARAPTSLHSRPRSTPRTSLFGGIATIVPASDYVSTFRGEGVEPDVAALAVADHVLTFRGDGLGTATSLPADGDQGSRLAMISSEGEREHGTLLEVSAARLMEPLQLSFNEVRCSSSSTGLLVTSNHAPQPVPDFRRHLILRSRRVFERVEQAVGIPEETGIAHLIERLVVRILRGMLGVRGDEDRHKRESIDIDVLWHSLLADKTMCGLLEIHSLSAFV
jgi:hypothetical protein